jgi:hypothetical protein
MEKLLALEFFSDEVEGEVERGWEFGEGVGGGNLLHTVVHFTA